jgi:predicted ribosome quality control (RQC) complex YloA/Tae2 family protein
MIAAGSPLADGLSFQAFWSELAPWLEGTFMQKMWQLGPEDYLLHFYRPAYLDPIAEGHPLSGKNELRIRLELTAQQVRVYPWLQEKPEAAIPSSFCMLLRKHCLGKKLCSLVGWRTFGLHKTVAFEFPSVWLILECWDRRPNLLLLSKPKEADPTDEETPVVRSQPQFGKILGGHRLGRNERDLRPGRQYEPDAPAITDPIKYQLFSKEPLFGLSAALEKALRGEASVKDDFTTLKKNWAQLWSRFLKADFGAGLDSKGQLQCYQQLIEGKLPAERSFATVFAGLSRASGSDSSTQSAGLDNPKRQLHKRWKALVSKQQRLVKAIEGDIELAATNVDLQEQTELLYALSPEQLEQPELVLNSWDGTRQYTFEKPLFIGYREMASKLAKKAKKLRNSLRHLQPRLNAEQVKLQELQEIGPALLSAGSASELQLLEQRLSELKSSPPLATVALPAGAKAKGPLKGRAPKAPLIKLPIQYRLNDGEHSWVFWVGRNSSQNEWLIQKIAKRQDLWFHIKQGSGSYVVLKLAGQIPPSEALLLGAWLAARYSSRKLDSHVEVVSTACENLRRPTSGPKGLVTYTQEMTLGSDPSTDPTVLLDENQTFLKLVS